MKKDLDAGFFKRGLGTCCLVDFKRFCPSCHGVVICSTGWFSYCGEYLVCVALPGVDGHQWKNSWRGMFSTLQKQLFRLHVYTNQPFSILFGCKSLWNSNWTFMGEPSLKSLWFIPNLDIQQIAMFLQSGLSVLNGIESWTLINDGQHFSGKTFPCIIVTWQHSAWLIYFAINFTTTWFISFKFRIRYYSATDNITRTCQGALASNTLPPSRTWHGTHLTLCQNVKARKEPALPHGGALRI